MIQRRMICQIVSGHEYIRRALNANCCNELLNIFLMLGHIYLAIETTSWSIAEQDNDPKPITFHDFCHGILHLWHERSVSESNGGVAIE